MYIGMCSHQRYHLCQQQACTQRRENPITTTFHELMKDDLADFDLTAFQDRQNYLNTPPPAMSTAYFHAMLNRQLTV